MYAELSRGRLKTGETLAVGVVEAPDPTWKRPVTSLLAHKDAIFVAHMQRSLTQRIPGLQTLYYVGLVDELPVTVAVVSGADGAGVHEHVHTRPEWRERGASSLLHEAWRTDVRQRGYRVLTLVRSPYDHVRRLYAGLGFREVAPGKRDMIWRAEPEADGPTRIGRLSAGPMQWRDWGWVSEACCAPLAPGEELPRTPLFGVRDAGCVEGRFIAAMDADVALRALRSDGACVGWVGGVPGPAGRGSAGAAEFYVHPGFRAQCGHLFEGFEWPPFPLVCVMSAGSGYRREVLAGHGFREAARWTDWWDAGRGREAVAVWVRVP